jgi:hypothetical protein
MLNEALDPSKAIKELNEARLLNLQLREVILELNKRFKKYTRAERKVSFNIENLYYQLVFLRQNGEHFGKIVIKGDKIIRLEAALEQES